MIYYLNLLTKFLGYEYKIVSNYLRGGINMKSPIIGITGDVTIAKFFSIFWNKRAGINEAYVKTVSRTPGIPIILPVSHRKNAAQLISNIDGLILSGGNDVSPEIYGEEPLSKLRELNPERDYFEIELLKEAIIQNKPVLGICRGFQLMNTAFGGTLYQDASYNEQYNLQHMQQTDPTFPIHSIKIKEGSIIHSILGSSIKVNSLHHQMLKDVSKDFHPTAWSKDGVIEAIEKNDGSFIIGVQWHPEILSEGTPSMQSIFDRFVREASK